MKSHRFSPLPTSRRFAEGSILPQTAVERGFEPAGSFYFSQNAERIRGKHNIDLNVDPPPDLVVEVDVASYSLDKLPIYAYLGISEVWRYADGQLQILGLRGQYYEAINESTVLPPLTSDVLARFVEEGLRTRRQAWVRRVREWARGRARRAEPGGG